jgi:Domain of unknown function (DUF3399)
MITRYHIFFVKTSHTEAKHQPMNVYCSIKNLVTHYTFSGYYFGFFLQKARLARIQIAKATSGAAFVAKKRAAEARIAAQEAGLQVEEDNNENIFELQHHHLLRCLEKTTVSLGLIFFTHVYNLAHSGVAEPHNFVVARRVLGRRFPAPPPAAYVYR